MESSSGALAIADIDGKILHANRTFLEAVGAPRTEDVLGRSTTEFSAYEHCIFSAIPSSNLTLHQQRLGEAERIAGVGSWYFDAAKDSLVWSFGMFLIFDLDPENGVPPFEEILARVHPDDRSRVEEAVRTIMIGRSDRRRLEYRILGPSGDLKYVDARGEVEFGPDGELRTVLGTVLDVTERRLAEIRQEELQTEIRRSEGVASLGRMVSGVAHEVRNPLFALAAGLDALETELGDREDLEAYLGMFRGQIGRMTKLMEDLLELGRPTTRELRRVPAVRLVEQALEDCRPQLKCFDLRVEIDLVPDAKVLVDRRRFPQAIINLVENAAQHSEPGGEILVRLRREDGDDRDGAAWICFDVVDSGPGVPTEDLDRLFEPFFSRRKGGTGLGLSIVQHLVESHDGTVQFLDRPTCRGQDGDPGGAWVEIRLPEWPPTAAPSKELAHRQSHPETKPARTPPASG